MSGEARLDGTLTVKPFGVSENTFPNAQTNIPLALLNGGSRSWTVQRYQVLDLDSPDDFTTINIVQAADLLYLRSTAKMRVEMTQEQIPPDPDLVSEFTITGLHLVEFPSDERLTGLRVQGVGTLEVFVCGAQ